MRITTKKKHEMRQRIVNSDLAIINLANAPSPLTRDAHRLLSLFGVSRGIDDQHAIRIAKVFCHLPAQSVKQLSMVPMRRPDEVLQIAAMLIEFVRDRFHIFPFQVRQQTREVLLGMLATHLSQALLKRCHECDQVRQHLVQQLRINLSLCKHLLLANFKASFHRRASVLNPRPESSNTFAIAMPGPKPSSHSPSYKRDGQVVLPSPHRAKIPARWEIQKSRSGIVRDGRPWTWRRGDLRRCETLGVDRLAISFAFDNPPKRRHILLNEEEAVRRGRGNKRMIQTAFEVIRGLAPK